MTKMNAMAPTRQVGAGMGVGALSAVVLAWVLREFGVVMPPEVVAASGALLNSLVMYIIGPDKS
jgi:hypothetical protein